MTSTKVNTSAEEWSALRAMLGDADLEADDGLDAGAALEDESFADLLAPSEEVRKVSRRIAGQYVEILAMFASSVFGRRTGKVSADRVGTAVDALLRLATAADDTDQQKLLFELQEITIPATTGRPNSRTRQVALAQLRDWLPRFGQTLEKADADRLTRLVRWDRGSVPLLAELRGLKGIGPKRLQRLYSAGLFTVDAVAAAQPSDVVAVTGIPLALAEEVVDATRRFAEAERIRFIEELREGAIRLRRMMSVLPDEDGDFALRASDALHEVERTLQHLQTVESQ